MLDARLVDHSSRRDSSPALPVQCSRASRIGLSAFQGSNLGPSAYQADALPTELDAVDPVGPLSSRIQFLSSSAVRRCVAGRECQGIEPRLGTVFTNRRNHADRLLGPRSTCRHPPRMPTGFHFPRAPGEVCAVQAINQGGASPVSLLPGCPVPVPLSPYEASNPGPPDYETGALAD